MANEKKDLIIRSIEDYKKLSETDKMYILGYIHGVLRIHEPANMQQTG